MESISFQDIQAIARRESETLNHYFVGVEHLFLALTRLKGSVTVELLEERGLLGYFWEAIAKDAYPKDEKNNNERGWPEFRITERAQKILDMAQDMPRRGISPDDRALLLAILNEGDSVPIRILEELGADLQNLRDSTLAWTVNTPIQAPLVPIQMDDPTIRLDSNQERLLRLMFRGADRIHVKRALTDGFGGSTVLLVQMRQTILNAPLVVKMDDRQSIQYEKMRYDQFVKGILPPNTSSIVEEPTFLADVPLGGIKYTFVGSPGADSPVNAKQYAQEVGTRQLERFLKDRVYEPFRHYWWGQGQTVRFQVWAEYEFLLPPALIVSIVEDDDATATNIRTLYPGGDWSRRGTVRVGEMVILEDFNVQKLKPEKGIVQLTAGAGSEALARSSRVDVRGLDFAALDLHRGQKAPRIIGRVMQTRADLLADQLQAIEPNFDLIADSLHSPDEELVLPNPLNNINYILEQWVTGRYSAIHGDLHTGNILVGPAGDAWLIDFEWTRQGHALFDWAVLETSLLIDLVAPRLDGSWDAAWQVVQAINTLNRTGDLPTNLPTDLIAFLRLVRVVRGLVENLLAMELWGEYYKALAMTSLRVLSWQTRPLSARRLTFLTAALYTDAIQRSESDPASSTRTSQAKTAMNSLDDLKNSDR